MKKLILLLALSSVLLFASKQAYAEDTEIQYVNKTIETIQGVDCNVWIATDINIKLGKNPYAVIKLKGWASTSAFIDGRPSLDKQVIVIEDIETLTVSTTEGDNEIYPLMEALVVQQILSNEKFSGGTLQTFTISE